MKEVSLNILNIVCQCFHNISIAKYDKIVNAQFCSIALYVKGGNANCKWSIYNHCM